MSGNNTSTQTTTYAIAGDDDLVLTDATSAGFTVTLPTAVGRKGKQFTIKRVDQTLANAVTIATTSSQTIDGSTTRKLMTQYEFYTVQSDGANWYVTNRDIPSNWTSYTPTFTAFGTVSGVSFAWRRVGSDVQVQGSFIGGTATGSEARMSLPSGLTSSSSLPTLSVAGKGSSAFSSATTFSGMTVLKEASVTYVTFGNETSTTSGYSKNAGTAFGTGGAWSFFASVPITNWEG